MNGREHRLRHRIDELADQRDAARLELDAVLLELATARHRRDRLRNRVYELTRSRDLWKLRARRPRTRAAR